MVIKPRQIEPGYQRRWFREAFELLRRAPEIWLLLGLLFAAVGFVAYPLLGSGQAILGLFEMYVVLHLAQVVSERHATLKDIYDAFMLAGPRFVRYLRTGLKSRVMQVGLGVSTLVVLLHCTTYFLGWDTPVQQLFSFRPDSFAHWVFYRNSPLFCVTYGLMWCLTTGGPFAMAVTLFVDYYDATLAQLLSRQAAVLNRSAVVFAFASMFVVLLAGYTFAPLGLFSALTYPLLSFVATRDIFLHGDGNRKLDKSSQTRVVHQPV